MPSNTSTSAVTVERLSASDLVAMAQCIAIDVNAFPYPSSRFVLRPSASPAWIARSNGESQVLGFLSASQRRQGGLYIEGIATAIDARRRGVARALLRACVEFARETHAGAISLHVWAGNVPAIELYRSEGFDVRLRVPSFYRRGLFASVDAFQMVLELRSSFGG
jgi:ribosomal-protein-alanine N-acetyltransferase